MATLKADAAVAALVGRKVFDVVPGGKGAPQAAAPPWIWVGPIGAPRFENDCYRAWQPRVRLFCSSVEFARGPVWQMVDAIDAALDRRTLDLGPDFEMTSPLGAIDSGDVIDPTKARVAFADFQCVISRTAPFDANDEVNP